MFDAGSASGARWHLIAVAPRKERFACGEMAASGLPTYLPAIEETVRHARRFVTLARPLFPGYAFAWFDVRDTPAWAPIFRTRGCVGVVRIAGKLASLSPEQYDALRALEDADGVIRPKRAMARTLGVGDQVRIKDGAWAGFVGQILAVRGPERVRLLLGALEVELQIHRIEAVTPAAPGVAA
jgi:transcription antitermination factor NusG